MEFVMAGPTNEAERFFTQAQNSFTRGLLASKDLDVKDQLAGLSNIAQGLGNLAVGVRATYMLLEEVKALLQRQARGGH
jgi:hypothetical protein